MATLRGLYPQPLVSQTRCCRQLCVDSERSHCTPGGKRVAPNSRKITNRTLWTLQSPFVKNKNDDKERNAHPERCGRERNLKRHAR